MNKEDSRHAQALAEHKDIIAEIIVDSLDIPTRSAVQRDIKIGQEAARLLTEKPYLNPKSGKRDLFFIVIPDYYFPLA